MVAGVGGALATVGALLPSRKYADDADVLVPINAAKLVDELLAVHGHEVLIDGCFNADPHPGNVLLLPDGRLGLIDFGMVGRLGPTERRSIARVTLGLAAGDQQAVVGEYERAGYTACWHSGERHGADAVYRFATFHLDRIDLSPVRLRSRAASGDAHLSSAGVATAASESVTMPLMTLLHSTIEHSVPDWIEQARRLGGLLIGVGSQAGRPISLAHEWALIARECIDAGEDEDGRTPLSGRRRAEARLRTHLTGLVA